ncbi:MAG: hypothetical protein COV44_05655 [Deltaproteobacteria bacterium CG11_big_fil_rev_8_21_14_0_20_45_16]|nr:MAG: hypothetical protein COV44_05655 [Deltaproteobacteria bacterium CG11_big_fil_rev_8_21_14_0_20_45_16]
MRIILNFIVFLMFSSTASAFDHTHQIWNEVLSRYVQPSGKTTVVDYKVLKGSPQKLNEYLKTLSSVSKSEYEKFSKSEKLAFLINAYNAFTLKLIINHHPVKSIKDIGSWFSSPWKKKFFNLLGTKMHLDGIEHDTIRANFDEPRIHFAVNCASIGCPSLATEAFVASRLDQQLEQAAVDFLTDESRNRFDPATNTLYLSQIFEWYGDDFKSAGGVRSFVSTRMAKEPKVQEKISAAKLEYLDYNWNLNQKTD